MLNIPPPPGSKKFRIPGKPKINPIPLKIVNQDFVVNIDEHSQNNDEQQQQQHVYHKKINFDFTRIIIWFNFVSIFILLLIVFIRTSSSLSTENEKMFMIKEPVVIEKPPPTEIITKSLDLTFTMTKMEDMISLKLVEIDVTKITSYSCCCNTDVLLSCKVDLIIDTFQKQLNISINDTRLIGSTCKFYWSY